jgi:hypothetical protein
LGVAFEREISRVWKTGSYGVAMAKEEGERGVRTREGLRESTL